MPLGHQSSTLRVFILGAGASVFAGYPLANDLLAFLRRYPLSDDLKASAASDIFWKLGRAATALERITNNKDLNLEILLTQLEIYKSIGSLHAVHVDWTQEDLMKLTRVITEQFLWYQNKIDQKFWRAGVRDFEIGIDPVRVVRVAEAWGELVQPGDILISFNWDLLHEAIFWRAKKWSYVDGYGFAIQDAGDLEPRSYTQILKPHGSVNWMQDSERDETPEIEFADHFFWRGTSPAREYPPKKSLDQGRKLILPTYLKDISKNTCLLRVWGLAQAAIRTATEIYVIGYSLNPADHTARLLLGTGLRGNVRIDKISVIGRSPGYWPDFLVGLGKKILPVEKTFEEWVLGT